MCADDQSDEEAVPTFRPFTREFLAAIKADHYDEDLEADPSLEAGGTLPKRLLNELTPDVIATPLQDIDKYYQNKKTFVVIGKGKNIFRFSATNALFLLSPLNPIRRGAIYILVHPIFSFFVITTILINFILMAFPSNPTIESTEIFFTLIFTLESIVRVLARGFILGPFSYFRDPLNCLDFVVISLAYVTMGVDLGNLSALRTFRIVRALKTVPGFKNIVGAISESAKKLKDVIIFTCFSLSIFAVLGLQMYMGVLTSKCIFIPPFNISEIGKVIKSEEFKIHANNITNQYINLGRDEPKLCRANANLCPEDYMCLTGFGGNPNYGYTNFDTFGWSLLSSFRLMTRDFWEDLYQSILICAGPWHTCFFVVIIFFESFYIVNLILAIVAVSYDELQRKKAADEEAEEAEEAAMQEAARLMNRPDQEKKGENDPKFKEKCLGQCMKCTDACCIWDCCSCWIYFQKLCSIIMFDPFMELFIALCVVLNGVFMAMDHHDMEVSFDMFLRNGNYFFTATFAIEAILKLIAMSPKFYFQDGWNRFDFFIAAVTLISLSLEGVQGLSVLRSFIILRLLRLFKFAQSWPALNLLISIMGKSVVAFGNSTFVLGLIISIFAVTGMQLFGANYIKFQYLFYGGEIPRWNFTDFAHSFMIVFRAICGEWIETLWDCMLVSGWPCIPLFIAIVVIGNLVVLNLFLAVLLSSFDASNISKASSGCDTKGIAEAFNRISRATNWVKQKFLGLFKEKEILGNQVLPQKNEDNLSNKSFNSFIDRGVIIVKPSQETSRSSQYGSDDEKKGASEGDLGEDINSQKAADFDRNKLERTTAGIIIDAEEPMNCCPVLCYQKIKFCHEDYNSNFWANWKQLRTKSCMLIANKYYETIIIIMIIISSLALAAEDVDLQYRPTLKSVLTYIDKVLTFLFFFEMLVKWLALGLRKYFTNAWCLLDFFILLVSVINLVASEFGRGNIQAFKTIRTLRALTPLRALSRFQEMRVVVNTLVRAIPAMRNWFLVCHIFWLIFAIMGVQLFGGKYHFCTEDGQEKINTSYVNTKEECMARNFTWDNPKINFDNVLNAYLALFQVATFKGWIDIMYNAVDTRQIDEQPLEEGNLMMYLYFVLFIIIGSFYTLNLFIGVIIDNFNRQNKKAEGPLDMFMTENQKKYYNAMKEKRDKMPVKATTPRPRFKPQAVVFDLTTNTKFDVLILLFIGLHMIVMATDHFELGETFESVLSYLNVFFIAIFTIECVLKMFAFGWYYFKEPWNVFDFIIVSLSILGIVLKDLFEKYFVSPTLLNVLRVLKVGRVLHLANCTRGIRTLLFVLAMSLPALFNLCLILFLVMFVYALFGMSFFMTVKHRYGIDENFNFETFGQSMILMVQLSTSAGWDTVLAGIMDETDCNPPYPEFDDPGNCGSRGIAVAYLVSYLIISFLIIINMCIVIILESYTQQTQAFGLFYGRQWLPMASTHWPLEGKGRIEAQAKEAVA